MDKELSQARIQNVWQHAKIYENPNIVRIETGQNILCYKLKLTLVIDKEQDIILHVKVSAFIAHANRQTNKRMESSLTNKVFYQLLTDIFECSLSRLNQTIINPKKVQKLRLFWSDGLGKKRWKRNHLLL
jgi:hypothetical protein